MKNDVLKLIIQAEIGYQEAVKDAVDAAEKYVGERRDEQSAFIKSLEEDWDDFEQKENTVLTEKLTSNEVQQEAALEKRKEDLRIRQQLKADAISERLKEEVLNLYGNR